MTTTAELATIGDRFRLLVESVTDYAIYMLDTTGVVVSWNAGAQRFKGYVEQEILGEHFSRFYTDEDRATGLPARALATALAEGRFEQEGWRVRKDGSRIWAHVVIDPIRTRAGRHVGFAKITRDITAQKAAQDALRQSEERFRILVQGVRDYAIYMLDPDGSITNWNTGAQRAKGYTEAEIVGQHFSRFYTEEDRASGLPARALATATQEGRFEQEGWRVRKDGTRFWAHVIVDAIRNDKGDLIGFAKITRDMTERRDAQIALEDARQRFVQAQKMEAIGQLTGGVAHDFNNLLAVVLGNLDLVRKRLPPDPRLRRLIENSITAAERGATLTRRMLAFARRQDLEAAPVDVPAVVRGMSDLLHGAIGRDIEIKTEFPLQLAPAFADANQLELCLLNLAVNARDAMPDGGTITVSAREEHVAAGARDGLAAGSYVVLAVADTGAGMSAETLARAVEPFFTTKGVGKGTGLGLSMIHGYAEQSGGRLVLRSTPGHGTTAELWLQTTAAPEETHAAEAHAPESVSLLGRQLTALVVDDDPLVLMNTSAMLEDLGHTVLEASSGEQGLRIAQRTPNLDLLITDQLMPGMKGTELIERLGSERGALPTILATGYADGLETGVRGIVRLAKPFTQNDLAEALVSAIRARANVLPFPRAG